jgi:hypothetical protein
MTMREDMGEDMRERKIKLYANSTSQLFREMLYSRRYGARALEEEWNTRNSAGSQSQTFS